jgi:hypothetical protein
MRTIRQVIPEEQVQILIQALRVYRFAVDSITEGEDERSKGFDTIGLEGLLHGKVVIEMTDEQKEWFGKHGVDYPEFVDESPYTLWARKCSILNKGMNEGWVVDDGMFYISTEPLAAAYAAAHGYNTIEHAVEDEFMYWTEWEEGEDYQYIEINGQLKEIES